MTRPAACRGQSPAGSAGDRALPTRPGSVPCTAVLAVSVITLAGCWLSSDKPFNFASLPPTPPAHLEGERLFNANCSSCHGPKASGSTLGPTLIHKIYEPSHHADIAFQLAVQRGVAPHHWRFGAMPAVPAVNADQAKLITSYIRWIQREAGIGG